jgi:periplasmic divalent cation tolerance protein
MAETAASTDLEDVCQIVITAPDGEWLAEFTRQLVSDKLAAAAHNVAQIRSIYRWQGEIYDRGEARVTLHTRAALTPAIIERVNREHPYEVPCVVATPIVAGNPAYIRWIVNETSEPTAPSGSEVHP